MILGIVASQITIQKTATPFIIDDSTTSFRYYVQNQDSDTATIYSIHNNPNPTTSRGSISSFGWTSLINTSIGTSAGSSVTIYAKAQASGKPMSDVSSLYIEA